MDVAFFDHYDSFSFNVIDWLTGKNSPHNVRRIPYDDIQAINDWLQDPTPFVLSPGPKAPEQAASSLRLCQQFMGKVPILGICLGHQILGVSLGGRIVKSKHLFHGSKRQINLNASFAERFNLPTSYTAATYNSLIVQEKSLPSNVTIAARNEFLEVEAIFYDDGEHPALGLQHHPESFLSQGHEGLLNLWQDWVYAYYAQKAKASLKQRQKPPYQCPHSTQL